MVSTSNMLWSKGKMHYLIRNVLLNLRSTKREKAESILTTKLETQALEQELRRQEARKTILLTKTTVSELHWDLLITREMIKKQNKKSKLNLRTTAHLNQSLLRNQRNWSTVNMATLLSIIQGEVSLNIMQAILLWSITLMKTMSQTHLKSKSLSNQKKALMLYMNCIKKNWLSLKDMQLRRKWKKKTLPMHSNLTLFINVRSQQKSELRAELLHRMKKILLRLKQWN